jgi:hypothetical protein
MNEVPSSGGGATGESITEAAHKANNSLPTGIGTWRSVSLPSEVELIVSLFHIERKPGHIESIH